MDLLTLALAKKYTDNKITDSPFAGWKREIVTSLPLVGSEGIIYMLRKTDSEGNVYYDEYIYTNNEYTIIGTTKTDLTNYAELSDFDLDNFKIDNGIIKVLVYDADTEQNVTGFVQGSTFKSVKESLENKQDKEDGKGLSSNDYTTAEKGKLASIESGANKTVVDTKLSSESENPVQNKVLASILEDKADKEYVGNYAMKKMETSTVLNNPLTANCNYFFTVDDNFILSFPTEDLTRGDTVYLNFECSADVTLIVDTSNTTSIDIIPEANKGYEVFGCWNGNKWILGYDEYDLPQTM